MKVAPADKDVSYSHLPSDMTFVQTGLNFSVFTEILSFFLSTSGGWVNFKTLNRCVKTVVAQCATNR